MLLRLLHLFALQEDGDMPPGAAHVDAAAEQNLLPGRWWPHGR